MSFLLPNPPASSPSANAPGYAPANEVVGPFAVIPATVSACQTIGLAQGIFSAGILTYSTAFKPSNTARGIDRFFACQFGPGSVNSALGFYGGGAVTRNFQRGSTARPLSFEINQLFAYDALNTIQAQAFCLTSTATSDAAFNNVVNGGNISGQFANVYGFVADANDGQFFFVDKVGTGAAVKVATGVNRNITSSYLMRIRVNPTQAIASIYLLNENGSVPSVPAYSISGAGSSIAAYSDRYFYPNLFTNNSTNASTMRFAGLWGYFFNGSSLPL